MSRQYVQQVTYEQMKEYGEYFRSLRHSVGLTLKEMAEELGVHYTNLYRWEKGRIIPKTDIDYIVKKIKSIVSKYKLIKNRGGDL
jgi:transcriptional regulator with XRE-family HTH domain